MKILLCLLAIFFGSRSGVQAEFDAAERIPLSFTRDPFIHPWVIEALTPCASGNPKTNQVVAVDLLEAPRNRRFAGEIGVTRREKKNPLVHSSKGVMDVDFMWFGYQYIGTTELGIIVLQTMYFESGSASWHDLVFLSVDSDQVINQTEKRIALPRRRLLLKFMSSYHLGDRWKGMLKVEGNRVFIGNDQGWYSKNRNNGEVIERQDDWARILDVTPQQQTP